MSKVEATLTVKVTYDVLDPNSVNQISRLLEDAAHHLASYGMLSGDDESLEVDEWSCSVETKDVPNE
jgi:hypothetical protein